MVSDDAKAAIEGILPCELCAHHPDLVDCCILAKLKQLEKLRHGLRPAWFSRKSDEVRILRAEVAELSLAYQKLQNGQHADSVQAANHREHIRIVGDMKQVDDLQKFLRDRFRSDLDGSQNLLELVKKIIERIPA